MRIRSILLVPSVLGALQMAARSGADAIVADLTADDGADDERRRATVNWLHEARRSDGRPALYVQVRGIHDDRMGEDLDAICRDAPDGIVLPGCCSGVDVQHLGAKLAVREADHSLDDGRIGIMAFAASSAAAVLTLASYAGASPRLRGLVLDQAALRRDLGLPADENEIAEPAPLSYARALLALGAKAAGIPAFEMACGLTADDVGPLCATGMRDGFSGVFTRVPAHIRRIAETYERGLEQAVKTS